MKILIFTILHHFIHIRLFLKYAKEKLNNRQKRYRNVHFTLCTDKKKTCFIQECSKRKDVSIFWLHLKNHTHLEIITYLRFNGGRLTCLCNQQETRPRTGARDLVLHIWERWLQLKYTTMHLNMIVWFVS